MNKINENNSIFASRFNEALKIRKMSAAELSRQTGINQSMISQYKKGDYNPKHHRLLEVAKALNVSASWLEGLNDEMEVSTVTIQNIENILKAPTNKIANIKTNYMDNFLEEPMGSYFVPTKQSPKADFCLNIDDDSMKNANIDIGDVVFIDRDAEIKNGDIAAILINEEIKLKRVYRTETTTQLCSENPKYTPIIIENWNIKLIKILGKAISIQKPII